MCIACCAIVITKNTFDGKTRTALCSEWWTQMDWHVSGETTRCVAWSALFTPNGEENSKNKVYQVLNFKSHITAQRQYDL